MSLRVIIGSSNEKVSSQLGQFLIENGYNVIGETRDGYDLLRRVHTVYPDLVIVDYNMRGLSGHEISEVLISEKVCPVVALLGSEEVQYFVNLSQEPTFAPLVKPLNKQMLLHTANLLIKTSKSIYKLENEVTSLKSNQDKKEIVNKAKKYLMENMQLTEEEAHRRIQKQSMDKGLSMIKIAEAILIMYE
ncbi:MAG: ANTAR domain-containing protein [Vallitaleaceae bacterium]|nr:ANTAR domain-containing protein [Vallitaleaceae bacterium]